VSNIENIDQVLDLIKLVKPPDYYFISRNLANIAQKNNYELPFNVYVDPNLPDKLIFKITNEQAKKHLLNNHPYE